MLIYLIKDKILLKLMYFFSMSPKREFSKMALKEYVLEERIDKQLKTLEDCEYVLRKNNRRGDEIFILNPYFPFKREFSNILLNYRLYHKDENLGILCAKIDKIECAFIFRDKMYLFTEGELNKEQRIELNYLWNGEREEYEFTDIPFYLMIEDREIMRGLKEGHYLKIGARMQQLLFAFNV